MRRQKKSEMTYVDKQFTFSTFSITFVALVILFTLQMLILGDYIDYRSVPLENIIAIICFWIATAFIFILVTFRQINTRYRAPIAEFAEATEKVANGDFSVYVSPRHSLISKQDPLDRVLVDFNKMVEELGSIETLKTDFFSNVSHEIRTPLSAIQNYAEMLQKDNLSDRERKEYADCIVQSTHRLSALITNILKLNKLEKQTIVSVPEPYDLSAQLCYCALQFEDVWDKKDIEFIADIEDRATIEADENLLEIVWNNLISNAIKFTEPGGTVTLKQSSTENEYTVSITDTGCGISEETGKHVFDKFYQGDTSHSMEGNGLGLALVLRILELTGGTIDMDSTPGKGTTFTVVLPVSSTLTAQ